MNTLFKNTNILLRDVNGYKTLKNAYLGVNGKIIDYIGVEKPDKEYTIEKDYSNKLLMSGLVNAHTHIPMVFLRGLGSNHNLQEWLNDFIFPTEAKLNEAQIKWASYYAMLEMLACGTTSFTDMYFFPEQTAQAVIETGIKANINKYINCFDDNQKIEDSTIPASLEFFKQYNNKAEGRLKVDFAIHAEYTNKPHIVKEYARLCKENKGHMHLHLSETKAEHEACIAKYGVTPAKWFEDLGVFESSTTAAHCVWCDKQDSEILAKHKVCVVHNPTSNMILGSGFAPIGRYRRYGVKVALGTDGAASNNNLNMFEEMHIANIISDGFHLDPSFIKNYEIIDMATINGAISQGRDDTGVLEVNKRADIIAIDLNAIHLYPAFDYSTLLVSSAQGCDVCMTMVDGNILYEDGNYLTLDKDKILFEFKKQVEEFY